MCCLLHRAQTLYLQRSAIEMPWLLWTYELGRPLFLVHSRFVQRFAAGSDYEKIAIKGKVSIKSHFMGSVRFLFLLFILIALNASPIFHRILLFHSQIPLASVNVVPLAYIHCWAFVLPPPVANRNSQWILDAFAMRTWFPHSIPVSGNAMNSSAPTPNWMEFHWIIQKHCAYWRCLYSYFPLSQQQHANSSYAMRNVRAEFSFIHSFSTGVWRWGGPSLLIVYSLWENIFAHGLSQSRWTVCARWDAGGKDCARNELLTTRRNGSVNVLLQHLTAIRYPFKLRKRIGLTLERIRYENECILACSFLAGTSLYKTNLFWWNLITDYKVIISICWNERETREPFEINLENNFLCMSSICCLCTGLNGMLS